MPSPPPTAARYTPPLTLEAMGRTIERLHQRIADLERDRTPPPMRMGDLQDHGPMNAPKDGFGPGFAHLTGAYTPRPILAEAVVHMRGALIVAPSDPWHARYGLHVIEVSADLGTYSTNIAFRLNLNGTPFLHCNMTSASFLTRAQDDGVTPLAQPMVAYTDLLTVETTSIGTGNSGLVVHVGLG